MKAPDSPQDASRARGLSAKSRRLRRTLLEAYTFTVAEMAWLERALESHDLADQCAQIIAREGLLVDGRAHPLLAVRRDALLAGARYWRQLRFSEDPTPARRAGRPKGEQWSPSRAAAAKPRTVSSAET